MALFAETRKVSLSDVTLLYTDRVFGDGAGIIGPDINPKAGLRCGGDVGATVADLHVFHRKVEAREAADVQSATDGDFHSEGVGGEGLYLALGIRSTYHEHDDPDEHKSPDHSADGEADELP